MNRLSEESSPYLLQHADNPVDWHPWDQKALAAAKEGDKPILLSVGYAACHWCHVMAHESFEDPNTAALMNEHFINIKVDREERPDIDRVYMNAVVAMTGQGGWPMTVILTPSGEPFFGGTYFPPSPRHGLPSFQQVLTSAANAWENRREEILDTARQMRSYLDTRSGGIQPSGDIKAEILDMAARGIKDNFDDQFGGFGPAPKFPQPMSLEYLLRYWLLKRDSNALYMAEKTLEDMAMGGIYDQLGGGFARYSTDKYWLVPHFEKMLYDNALLANVYLNAWKITKRPFFKRISAETLNWMLTEMRHEQGGFYSSLDADSEGVEGKYYVWSTGEIRNVLEDDAENFIRIFGLSDQGNWEGTNILHGPADAGEIELELNELLEMITSAKDKLLAYRWTRIRPGLDDKVLTSWNGLAMSAFAEAGRAYNREEYLEAATGNAEFLYRNLRRSDGRLYRTWKDGHTGKVNGFLEDYAFLAEGLLSLYEATFDERWYLWAKELAELVLRHFSDGSGSGFFDTSDDHENLVSRPREIQDNAIPCGSSSFVTVLLRLYLYSGEERYWREAYETMSAMQDLMSRYPLGFGKWLSAAALLRGEPIEVAISGDPNREDTQQLIAVLRTEYRPFMVTAAGDEGSAIPLLRGRKPVGGKAAAYVCRGFACDLPSTAPDELRRQIEAQIE